MVTTRLISIFLWINAFIHTNHINNTWFEASSNHTDDASITDTRWMNNIHPAKKEAIPKRKEFSCSLIWLFLWAMRWVSQSRPKSALHIMEITSRCLYCFYDILTYMRKAFSLQCHYAAAIWYLLNVLRFPENSRTSPRKCYFKLHAFNCHWPKTCLNRGLKEHSRENQRGL